MNIRHCIVAAVLATCAMASAHAAAPGSSSACNAWKTSSPSSVCSSIIPPRRTRMTTRATSHSSPGMANGSTAGIPTRVATPSRRCWWTCTARPPPGYANSESYHISSSPQVDVDGNHAIARSRHLLVMRGPKGEPTPMLAAATKNEFIREDGQWKILRRVDTPVMPTAEEWIAVHPRPQAGEVVLWQRVRRRRPVALVVMGVSGSGKSTLAEALAARLGATFIEGDALHGAASVAKMRAGQALDDAIAGPGSIASAMRSRPLLPVAGSAIAACSALRFSYRERLRRAVAAPLGFILLELARDALAQRMHDRPDHFMPASLLDSQLATLESAARRRGNTATRCWPACGNPVRTRQQLAGGRSWRGGSGPR